jgi:ditrans,polycis-polyprenyl diphosphate synthase
MKEIVQWCLELGVACVSVYAFSIDNFRRPPEEVDALMELAAAKFEELLHVSVTLQQSCRKASKQAGKQAELQAVCFGQL